MDDAITRDPRGQIADDAETLALIDRADSTEEIPTLDFAPYLEGRPGGLEEVAQKLREISMTVGFFYLKNHGIPQKLIDDAFAETRRFHSLSTAEKKQIPWYDKDRFKLGYQPYQGGGEYANTYIVSDVQPNLYAKYSFIREEPGQPTRNTWPQNLPGFRETVQRYHAEIEKLGRKFLPPWSQSLKLPLDYFEPMFTHPHVQLSLLHYPPQKEVGNRQYGIAPHTDNAMMTFLAQAEVPGLAVRMPSGRWRAVDIVPGTLLVNTGNSIVQWTNEDYLSTKHRVINTNNVDRYSMPVFFGPNDDVMVEVVPTCKGPDRPALYEPISYGDLRAWYNDGAPTKK